MPPNLGTRTKATLENERLTQSEPNGSITRDLGMTKLVTATITFSRAASALQAANGTFSAFAPGDPIEVTNTLQNDGFFTVTGTDAVNGSFLTVDPPPTTAGPSANVQVRTP